jgi:hypothetical protein
VERPCLVVLPCHAQPAAWLRRVVSPGIVAVPCKWSAEPTPHWSHLSACLGSIDCTSCPLILQVMMALTSGALETCARALGICGSSYTGRSARLSFMLEVRGPQESAGHAVATPEPSQQGGRIWSLRTRDAPEPSPVGR